METKTGKRIVSKGAYATAQGKRAVVSVFGVALTFLTVILGFITVACFLYAIYALFSIGNFSQNLMDCIGSLLGGSFFAGITYLSGRQTQTAWNHLPKIDPGIPLTRANTADLPAPDSLVRASSEPVHVQEAVLLRAAAEGGDRHEEQLVRASVAGK